MHIMKCYTFLENYVFPVCVYSSCRLAVSVGHIQTLQAVIATLTDSVTRPCGKNEDTSGAEVTAKCLKLSLTLARNLCAGVQHNQAMLW